MCLIHIHKPCCYRYLMAYDTVVFLACVGWGLFELYGRDPALDRHILLGRLFHLKILYSLLSLPWFLLKLPLAFTLCLHLKPTAYTRSGKTVRLATGKERAEARERRRTKAVAAPAVQPQAEGSGSAANVAVSGRV